MCRHHPVLTTDRENSNTICFQLQNAYFWVKVPHKIKIIFLQNSKSFASLLLLNKLRSKINGVMKLTLLQTSFIFWLPAGSQFLWLLCKHIFTGLKAKLFIIFPIANTSSLLQYCSFCDIWRLYKVKHHLKNNNSILSVTLFSLFLQLLHVTYPEKLKHILKNTSEKWCFPDISQDFVISLLLVLITKSTYCRETEILHNVQRWFYREAHLPCTVHTVHSIVQWSLVHCSIIITLVMKNQW